jgi:hypothetical protein
LPLAKAKPGVHMPAGSQKITKINFGAANESAGQKERQKVHQGPQIKADASVAG